MARPSEYCDETADRIVDRIELGESIRQICADPDMPSRPTIRDWARRHQHFADRLQNARINATLDTYDEMQAIEQDARDGKLDARVAQVILQSKQWRLAKMNKGMFGDARSLEVSGPGGGPVQVTAVPPDVARAAADNPVIQQALATIGAEVARMQRDGNPPLKLAEGN